MDSSEHISTLRDKIEPLRQEIINHPVYKAIESLDDLKIFMQFHVYAVWDFMSILKTLQNNLTCTTVPWHPVGSADTRFLINEIVVGEEADVDQNGVRMSHFELYLQAMKQCNADTTQITHFIDRFLDSKNIRTALLESNTPSHAAEFVVFTFDAIQQNKIHCLASIFTFGREDLIPGMFLSMVEDIFNQFPEDISTFKYYLERHIEVDGDHHSHLALQMTQNLCADNPLFWKEAELAAINALKARITLWNGAYAQITKLKLQQAAIHAV